MRLLGFRFVSASLAVASCVTAASAAAADYGVAGPHKTLTKNIAGFDGLEGQVAYPDTKGGSYPVIVLAHGFASGPDKMIGWGEHLASHGFVAVSLKNCGSGFVCAPDPNAEAGLVEKALTYVEGGIAPEGVTDQADASRFLLLGHSAGGQVATVAAAKLKPAGLVLFDPVGGGQSGTDFEPAKSALATVCAPVLSVFAEAHDTGGGPFAAPSCNKKGAWMDFASTSTGPRVSVVVKGSTHCDGELPARAACGFTCGGAADANRQKTYRHYATAFALATLENNAAAAAELVPSALESDTRVKDGKATGGAACDGAAGAGGSDGGAGMNNGGAAGTTAEGGAAGATAIGGAAGKNAGGAAGTPGVGGKAGSGPAAGGGSGSPSQPGGAAGALNAGGKGGLDGKGGTSGTSNAAGAGGTASGGTAGLGGQVNAGAGGTSNTTSLGLDEDSGCGCRVATSQASPLSIAGLLALGAALLGRRRRAKASTGL